MQNHETVIIGGGISGLACGRTLADAKKDFLLVSSSLGGRMITSKKGHVDYGASYVTSEYHNIQKYVDKTEPIRLKDCYYEVKGEYKNCYNWDAVKQLPKLIWLYLKLNDFRKRLAKLRTRAMTKQQKEALEEDPVLSGYIRKPAEDFIKENKLEKLNETYFEPVFHSTVFIKSKESSTFHYFDCMMCMICKLWMADFTKAVPKLITGWEKKIKKEKVKKLVKTKEGYKILTNKKTYQAKNVVIAMPYPSAKKMWNVPKPKYSIPIYVFDIKGIRKKPYQGKQVVFFKPKHEITIQWQQPNGTDIVFSHQQDPKLNNYYENYKIIGKKYWNPGVTLSGSKWTKQKLDNGLYLASEYNICGLEDSYITGVYAANQIIKSSK